MAAEDREIELKFLCEPRDLDAVLAAAPAGETETRIQRAVYFDTADGRLARNNVSLRVRLAKGRHIQTLKRGEGFGREEFEQSVAGEALDLSMPALKAALSPARRKGLQPTFVVEVERRLREVAHQGALIEIAADHGRILAADRSSQVCEIELELASGRPAALFDLAQTLSRAAPLYLSYEGKAAQGQRLGAGSERTPRKGPALRLDPGAGAAATFQTVARTALSQIAANAALARSGERGEAIHQLRVATRRLRSLLKTHEALVGGAAALRLRGELKWLADACGEARDLDVFAEALGGRKGQAAAATAAILRPPLEAAIAKAYAKAGVAIASARFRDLTLALAAFIETGEWLEGRARKARAVAREVLDDAWKSFRRRARGFETLDAEDLHRLRLRAKALRYAVEAYAPLFDDPAPMIAALKRLQDELGRLNDAAQTARMVGLLRLDAEGQAAAARLARLRRPPTISRAAQALERALDAPKFWR